MGLISKLSKKKEGSASGPGSPGPTEYGNSPATTGLNTPAKSTQTQEVVATQQVQASSVASAPSPGPNGSTPQSKLGPSKSSRELAKQDSMKVATSPNSAMPTTPKNKPATSEAGPVSPAPATQPSPAQSATAQSSTKKAPASPAPSIGAVLKESVKEIRDAASSIKGATQGTIQPLKEKRPINLKLDHLVVVSGRPCCSAVGSPAHASCIFLHAHVPVSPHVGAFALQPPL